MAEAAQESTELRGLTSEEAKKYQREHGFNEFAEHKRSWIVKLALRAASPISAMLAAAALLSLFSGKVFDASFIFALLVLNVGVSAWQEHRADTAIERLNERITAVIKVLRDGTWTHLSARLLVPGDIIELNAGSVVPADGTIRKANRVSVNEAALTGESLPKERKAGEKLSSGTFLSSGYATVAVTATGSHTAFGKTLALAGGKRGRSTLEKDILRISRFLSLLSLGAVVLLSLALFAYHASFLDVLRLDLSLIIAGIPVSLPTVMTLIIAYGVLGLSKEGVIVRRLAALEELANTDLLLTDKTGTLTKNHIVVAEIIAYDSVSKEQVHDAATSVACQNPDELLNAAVCAGMTAPHTEVVDFIPADPSRKRGTLVWREGGQEHTRSLGAPQVIAALCTLTAQERSRFDADVERFAARGYRALALAQADGHEEAHMTLLGILALSDELRDDAKETVAFLAANGVEVVMVTGNNRAIAREVAAKLELPGKEIVTHEEVTGGWEALTAEDFAEAQGFAEIKPEDKLALVERAKRYYTVAASGDGVNDLPAVSAASVGFAVVNAVDALKGAADIVLLSAGIGVMKNAVIEGRKIFERLYAYSLYRISESFRLIVTIVVLGLATGSYPLTPLELILLALLNDIPIITLATDRVELAQRPAKINVKRQFTQSLLYGSAGIANSLLLYVVAVLWLHLPLPVFETLFFLKLTVSGHLLIYVAHTKQRWWRYLPSWPVIAATSATQALATGLALTGALLPAAISWQLALFIWVWSFIFMQITEALKRRPQHA